MALGLKLLSVVALVVVASGAYGCARPSPSLDAAPSVPAATPTPVNPEALLRESGQVMEGLSAFHFRLEHERGGTPLAPNLVLVTAEGDVAKPDRISTEFSASVGGFAVRSRLITIGETSFMTNPLRNGEWERVPTEVSPLGFFDPQGGISAMMAQVEGPSLLSSDGKAHRVRGALPASALAPLFGAAVADGMAVAIEVTIDAETLHMIQARLEGTITAEEQEGIVRIITLSRFNAPAAIEPPLR